MERLVCDLKWLGRLSWAISILMFIAITVFGAPLATFFIGAAVMIIGLPELKDWLHKHHRH